MEPKLRSFLFCDAVVPGLENKMICYGVFSDLFVPSFPVTIPHFSTLAIWTAGEGFHVQQIKILTPSKNIILSQSPEMFFTLANSSESVYVKSDVNQLNFTELGAYIFQIILDGEILDEISLHIRLKK